MRRKFLALFLATLVFASGCTRVFTVSSLPDSVVLDVSADGRYVLLVTDHPHDAADTNGFEDIYRKDTIGGGYEWISVSSGLFASNGPSITGEISDDGDIVAFVSFAANLVPLDFNGSLDAFTRVVSTGTTTRVSVTQAGAESNGATTDVAISGNGLWVAWTTNASNIYSLDINGPGADVYRTKTTGTNLSIVSGDPIGIGGSADSFDPSIDYSGEIIAFVSYADELAAGDTNGEGDILMWSNPVIDLVSSPAGGGQSNGLSANPSIDRWGANVAFESFATNLVAGDTNGVRDIFVGTSTGVTERVSITNAGGQSNGETSDPSISGDGGAVVFHNDAPNIGSTNAIHARDISEGRTFRVSEGTDYQGPQPYIAGYHPAFSDDGLWVAFSDAFDGSSADAYLKYYPQIEVISSSPATIPRGQTTSVTVTGYGFRDGMTLRNVSSGGANGGMEVTNVVVVNGTTITADVVVSATATSGPHLLTGWVNHADYSGWSGEYCENCLLPS